MISNATGIKYYIRWDSNCSTPNVVYMALDIWQYNIVIRGFGTRFFLKKCKNTIKNNILYSQPTIFYLHLVNFTHFYSLKCLFLLSRKK